MKKTMAGILTAVAVVALCAGPAAAGDATMPEESKRAPGAAIAAAALNLTFMPFRLAWTVVGAELGGVVGLMTAGNEQAAEDVWYVFRGQNYITPEVVRGQESLRFGSLEFRGQ